MPQKANNKSKKFFSLSGKHNSHPSVELEPLRKNVEPDTLKKHMDSQIAKLVSAIQAHKLKTSPPSNMDLG
jgi:hypothetical protein